MSSQQITRHGFLDNLRNVNAKLLTSVLINLAILFLARLSIVLAFALNVFQTQSFLQQFNLFFLAVSLFNTSLIVQSFIALL